MLVELDLDGTGAHRGATGVGFYDHMLTSFGKHGLFDLTVGSTATCTSTRTTPSRTPPSRSARHSPQALGDKSGIRRFGDALMPMDETLAQAAVDLSGRPYCVHTGEPDGWPASSSARNYADDADPARLRVACLPRAAGAARPGAARPRPAPRHRGAVQGAGAGVARGGRARPARAGVPSTKGVL